MTPFFHFFLLMFYHRFSLSIIFLPIYQRKFHEFTKCFLCLLSYGSSNFSTKHIHIPFLPEYESNFLSVLQILTKSCLKSLPPFSDRFLKPLQNLLFQSQCHIFKVFITLEPCLSVSNSDLFFFLHSKLLRTFAVKTATLTYFAYKSSFGKAPWGQLVSTLCEVTLGGWTRVERFIHTIVHVCGWLVYANCWLCAYLRLLTESLVLLSCGFSKCCLDFLRTWWLRCKNGCFIRQ